MVNDNDFVNSLAGLIAPDVFIKYDVPGTYPVEMVLNEIKTYLEQPQPEGATIGDVLAKYLNQVAVMHPDWVPQTNWVVYNPDIDKQKNTQND